jgi:hypothetical protein
MNTQFECLNECLILEASLLCSVRSTAAKGALSKQFRSAKPCLLSLPASPADIDDAARPITEHLLKQQQRQRRMSWGAHQRVMQAGRQAGRLVCIKCSSSTALHLAVAAGLSLGQLQCCQSWLNNRDCAVVQQ